MFTLGKVRPTIMSDTTTTEPAAVPDSELAAARQAVLDYAAEQEDSTRNPEPEVPETVEEALARVGAHMVYGAIQNASNGTDRSAQQQDYRLGMSNLGHCRQYAALMTKQVAFSDVSDKTAAFIGTVLGNAIEHQLEEEHPDWIFQTEGFFKLPSGGGVPGHPDIVIPASAGASLDEFMASVQDATAEDGSVDIAQIKFPQGVWDLKSKDQLDSIREYGQTQQQRFQLTGYASAMIDAGELNADEPIWLMDVYFDRSGRVHEAYAIGHWYDPNTVTEIDDWVNDVKYAVVNNEDAARDMNRDWCWSWCEYATVCRGNDTDVEGLVDDPEFLAAVDMSRRATDLTREADRLKDSAKKVLEGRSGSTGAHIVRWIEIGASTVNYTRKAYKKLSITPIGKPKKPAKPRARKPKAAPTPTEGTTSE